MSIETCIRHDEKEDNDMTMEQIENELLVLCPAERLKVARWLLDTLLEPVKTEQPTAHNPLLSIAGRFSGGPGDTAEKAEEILASEVNSACGLGSR